MPHWVKIMEDTLTRKRKYLDQDMMQLTKECSSIIQKKLPEKMEDLESFTIPCTIGNNFFGRALYNLRASINIMPSWYTKSWVWENVNDIDSSIICRFFKEETKGSYNGCIGEGDKFILQADFVILDMEEDWEIPFIFGWPFLSTGETVIDVKKWELSMTMERESIKFNVLKAVRYPIEDEDCYRIEVKEEIFDYVQHGAREALKIAIFNAGEDVSKEVRSLIHDLDSSPFVENCVFEPVRSS